MAEQAIEPLLAELRSVIESADPIPDAVLAAARASFSWRTIDAELAELVADSAAEATSAGATGPRQLAGATTRAGVGPRLLTFEGAGLTVEVEIAETGPGGGSRRLVGQLIPVGPAAVSVRWAEGSTVVSADDYGRFSIDEIPAGPVSMAVTRLGATTPVVTSWVAI